MNHLKKKTSTSLHFQKKIPKTIPSFSSLAISLFFSPLPNYHYNKKGFYTSNDFIGF